MNISIFGLGYVGAVSAGCLASLGHHVIGVDINKQKIEMINNGRSPTIEKDINSIINTSQLAGRLYATTSTEEAVFNSDISMICVGTPSLPNGDLNMKYVEQVCYDIGKSLLKKENYHIIVVRSTIFPGCTEKFIIPILEQASGRCVGKDFGIVFNPEFLREGTSVEDFFNPPFTIIGHQDQRSAEVAGKIYDGIDAPMITVPLKVAEMVKYANNSFHALKVAFANEIGTVCKLQGIDSHQVMDIFCLDKKLNLSPYYLRPGFAFGGSCLPKDVRALLYNAHRMDLNLPVLEAILPSNELQMRRSFKMISQTGYKRVGILGISFKAGTDDLRESPMVELIEILLGKGYQVRVYDQNVSLSKLFGANKDYIEKTIPHISSLMYSSIEEVLEGSDVIVVGNRSPEFVSLPRSLRNGQIIVDLVRILDDQELTRHNYQGICW